MKSKLRCVKLKNKLYIHYNYKMWIRDVMTLLE